MSPSIYRYLLAVVFCLTTLTVNSADGQELYITKDANGNPVYSDRKPEKGNFIKRQQNNVQTVSWKQTPSLKISNQAAKRHAVRSKDESEFKRRKKQCQSYSQKINKTQNRLRQKQNPQAFERLKKSLAEARSNYRKQCKYQ